jgi:hypothetical protein
MIEKRPLSHSHVENTSKVRGNFEKLQAVYLWRRELYINSEKKMRFKTGDIITYVANC